MSEHAQAASGTLYDAPSPEMIAEIVRDVWATFLDPDPSSLLEAATELPSQRVSACVHLSGAWTGSVMTQWSATAAREAAAALFAMDAGEVTQAEVVDAVGEVVNMLGGNVKSLLPGPSALSLPTVADGEGSGMFVPGAQLVRDASMLWRGEPVVLSVWQVRE